MPEIPTVAIYSPKDASQMWIINADDYDAEKHQLWGESEAVAEAEPVGQADEPEAVEHHRAPSVPDFIEDEGGNIVAVNIIDPERRNARKELPFESYDPDHHELWSSHPRFNR